MWETKGSLDNITIVKLVWCVMQCMLIKKWVTLDLSYEITLMWCS
jgi:hypothetical protein